jgi:hypothetical protein
MQMTLWPVYRRRPAGQCPGATGWRGPGCAHCDDTVRDTSRFRSHVLLCATVRSLRTRFAKIFGGSISETIMRPNPRHATRVRAARLGSAVGSRAAARRRGSAAFAGTSTRDDGLRIVGRAERSAEDALVVALAVGLSPSVAFGFSLVMLWHTQASARCVWRYRRRFSGAWLQHPLRCVLQWIFYGRVMPQPSNASYAVALARKRDKQCSGSVGPGRGRGMARGGGAGGLPAARRGLDGGGGRRRVDAARTAWTSSAPRTTATSNCCARFTLAWTSSAPRATATSNCCARFALAGRPCTP